MSENMRDADWQKSSYSNGTGNCAEVATWRKSSHSNDQGQCIEVGAIWRKPTHSNSAGSCVEIGKAPTAVLVRDTTNRSGVTLTVSAETWRALLAKLRAS
jgi:hypothetical protein